MKEMPLSSFIDHCNDQENEHPNFRKIVEHKEESESSKYQ